MLYIYIYIHINPSSFSEHKASINKLNSGKSPWMDNVNVDLFELWWRKFSLSAF